MRIAVLGAGVAGLTSAYYLSEFGYSVTVYDRAAEVASACSHANGCQLSYSFVDALAKPSLLKSMPSILLGRDPAIKFRPALRPAFGAWGIEFLRQCKATNATSNTVAALQMASHSADLFATLFAAVNIDFSYRKVGKLVLISSQKEFASARRSVKLKKSRGIEIELLNFAEACALEPAIAQMRGDHLGAIFSPGDAVGDARAFTEGLADWLRLNRDVKFMLETPIDRLHIRENEVRGIKTADEEHDYDAVIVSLGAWSPALLRPAGIKSRIYPVRGYSITLPAAEAAPDINLTYQAGRIVFSKIDAGVRIAGFADLVGFRSQSDAARIATLLETARHLAPHAADYESAATNGWSGSRPMTPDGRPLVGRTKVRGLYLNTGHGMLGWTFAAATAHEVATAVHSDMHRSRPATAISPDQQIQKPVTG